MVEHLTVNQENEGSSPSLTAKPRNWLKQKNIKKGLDKLPNL